MLPILFRIPILGWPIYSYGLMMVIGFLCAIELAKFLARRSKLDPELFITVGLIALVAGVVGARLSHVLENFHEYSNPARSIWANVWDAINIRSGGLTYYGGFLLAFPILVGYALVKKIPLRLGMDIIAPCLMVGLAFGRIGCFLNGCCYGATCNLPWAMTFPYDSIPYQDEVSQRAVTPPADLVADDPHELLMSITEIKSSPRLTALAAQQRSLHVHPAQLYSSFTGFLIAALCLSYFTMPHLAGRVFALMMMVEGLTRYLLELLRVEPPVVYFHGYGLSLSMVLGIAMVGIGVVLWFVFGYTQEDRSSRSIRAVGAVG